MPNLKLKIFSLDCKNVSSCSICSEQARAFIKSIKLAYWKFSLETDNCKFDTTGIMVSLYTTSTSNEELKKNFDLSDFYENSVDKEIGNSKIIKYFVKG